MALRARLVAPPPEPRQVWPWHTPKCASMPSTLFLAGDRRMEAETYLSSGFGLRTAIQSKSAGWVSFGKLARVWMPNRLKGIVVSPEYGTPFLAATQVFDIRPISRKWLSLDHTENVKDRFVDPGTILVTRSGSVGRAILAYAPHKDTLISDDLLRVEPLEEKDKGWLYAYLHAPQVRAMASGAHYGNIIKHLETSHLEALPVPLVDDDAAADFSRRVSQILELRNTGYRLALEAEEYFENKLGSIEIQNGCEHGFPINASRFIVGGRIRLDASFHNPIVTQIYEHLAKSGKGFTTVKDAGYDVWVPSRYKRIPAEDGVLYCDSEDLMQVSPDLSKRYADCGFGDSFRGRVKSGWILIPSSGQVYGIIGNAVIASELFDDRVVSNHVIRVAPRKNALMRTGYLLTAISHPLLGRPLLKALAFGSSVPEIDPNDIASLKVVRLKHSDENIIADIAERSAAARAEADLLERDIARDAGVIIDRFMAQI